MRDELIGSPPAGEEGWREVWTADRRFPPRPSKHEWFLRIMRRLFRRATEPDTERQNNFNIVVLDLLRDLRRDIATMRDDFRRDLEAVQRDVRIADEALAAEIAAIRELIPVAAKRNDALIAALDQKIESVAVRVRDVTNPVVERSIAASDVLYRRLEDGLRGSESEVRASVADYIELAKTHAPVLDVGCGRGEMLAACRDAAISARGFDMNERSVADLRALGFDVTLAGIPECFREVADASVGMAVAMHVVEHLPVEALFALFAESKRVLRAGGVLVIETPNAEALAMTGGDFWRDPTHLAPRHPAALSLLAREYGFAIDEIRAIHPFPEGAKLVADSPAVEKLVDALNERMFSGQDLRMILRR